MTLIIAWRGDGFMFLCSDTRVCAGNLNLPLSIEKIFPIGSNVLLGGAGAVSGIQQLSKTAVKSIQLKKLMADAIDLSISPSELSWELAQLNFSLPLEYKDFSSFGFLCCGYDANLQEFQGFEISDDGAVLPIERYFAIGSGSELAYSLLEEHYNPNLTKEEVSSILFNIIDNVSRRDLAVEGKNPSMFCVETDQLNKWQIIDTPKEEIKKPKKVKKK